MHYNQGNTTNTEEKMKRYYTPKQYEAKTTYKAKCCGRRYAHMWKKFEQNGLCHKCQKEQMEMDEFEAGYHKDGQFILY